MPLFTAVKWADFTEFRRAHTAEVLDEFLNNNTLHTAAAINTYAVGCIQRASVLCPTLNPPHVVRMPALQYGPPALELVISITYNGTTDVLDVGGGWHDPQPPDADVDTNEDDTGGTITCRHPIPLNLDPGEDEGIAAQYHERINYCLNILRPSIDDFNNDEALRIVAVQRLKIAALPPLV